MRNIRITSTIFCFITSIFQATGSFAIGGDSPVSLERAVAAALVDNPGLAKMQARYEAMNEMPSQKGALPDPMISLGAMNFPTDTFDRDQEPMTQLKLQLTQMFPFPGKRGLREEAANLNALAANHALAEMRLMVVDHVKHKWWQIFYLDRALKTIESNQSLLRQFIDVAKKKYETGKGLQQDVLLAQLNLSQLIDKSVTVTAMRRKQSIMLNQLMDRPVEDTIFLYEDIDLSLPALQPQTQLHATALEVRPLLKEKQKLSLSAEKQLALSKKSYYPDFTLSIAYGDRTGNNPMPMGGSRTDFVSLMVGVNVPLYTNSKQSSAISQKTSEFEKSRYEVLEHKRKVMAMISRAVTDYERAKEQRALYENGILPQARQTVQSMLAAYQVGQVDFLNLVRAQVTLFNYELVYWKTLAEAKQSLSKIQAEVGVESIYE